MENLDNVKIFVEKKVNSIPDKMIQVTKKFLVDDNRRYFGIAATSLQNQLDDPKYKEFNINRKLVTAGIDGEKKTSELLKEWIKDKPEVILIDSISLPLSKFEPEQDGDEGQLDLGDTDHALIIGNNVIIIDSKNWKGKATYKFNVERDESQNVIGIEILRSNNEFIGNKPRINQAKYLWNEYLKDMDIENVYAYVCISHPETTIIRDRDWWVPGYKLVNQTTLIYFLDRYYNEQVVPRGLEKTIRIELVAKILMGLSKPYNKFKEKLGLTYERLSVKTK